MQITSPLFLFLFLPLSLPVLPLCKKRYRKIATALLCVAFLILANLQNPWGFLPIGAVLLCTCLLVCIPAEIFSRLRLILGVSIPLAILLAARLATELFPQHHTYPLGLGLITLGAISICVDHYRADVIEREDPLSAIGYLLFFPTVTLGPVLRYKQYLYLCEHARPALSNFSEGVLLYIKGYLKRIAICTILFASLHSLLSASDSDTALPFPALILALPLSYLALYFTVSGITDMSRGLMALYGYTPPRGQARFFNGVTPHRALSALLCSLDAFLEDYLGAPLKRRVRGTGGKMLAAVLICICTVLFYRTHPAMLLIALPLLACAALTARLPRYARHPRNPALRILFSSLSALYLSLFALALSLDDPLSLFPLLANAFQKIDLLAFYHILLSFSYLNHLIVVLLFLLLYAPLSYYVPRLFKKLPARVRTPLRYAGALLAMAAFLLALLFLLPQFPQYAELAYGKPLM